jgi:hypothetical protein
VHVISGLYKVIIPAQGEFGKWHPGWGREYRKVFLWCKREWCTKQVHVSPLAADPDPHSLSLWIRIQVAKLRCNFESLKHIQNFCLWEELKVFACWVHNETKNVDVTYFSVQRNILSLKIRIQIFIVNFGSGSVPDDYGSATQASRNTCTVRYTLQHT